MSSLCDSYTHLLQANLEAAGYLMEGVMTKDPLYGTAKTICDILVPEGDYSDTQCLEVLDMLHNVIAGQRYKL